MQLVDTTDALGGTGSIPDNLRQIATQGLSRLIDGVLSRKYPLSSFNESQAQDASGNLVPKSAPQTQVNASRTFMELISQPAVLVGVGAVIVVGVLAFAISRK